VVKKKKAGWGASAAAKPLSVEELLRKKREADAAAAKVGLFLFWLHQF
jgi:ATP-dependent RNA helicase DDX23/PRP28